MLGTHHFLKLVFECEFATQIKLIKSAPVFVVSAESQILSISLSKLRGSTVRVSTEQTIRRHAPEAAGRDKCNWTKNDPQVALVTASLSVCVFSTRGV